MYEAHKERGERRGERKPVSWLAHASNDKVHMIAARVLDVSHEGIFIEKSPGVKAPERGAELNVDVFAGGLQPALRTTARVRWVGKSEAHGCEGIGIEFAEPADIHPFG